MHDRQDRGFMEQHRDGYQITHSIGIAVVRSWRSRPHGRSFVFANADHQKRTSWTAPTSWRIGGTVIEGSTDRTLSLVAFG
jgi:hypothetical protein